MRIGLVALVALVALSACGGTREGPAAGPHPSGSGGSAAGSSGLARPGSPAAACVQAAPGPAGPEPSGPAPAASAGPRLDDLALACFPGGGEVRLASLGRPAVINLWASWCTPCRQELPAFESYFRRTSREVLVIGVATATSRPAAQSIVDELGLTFPMLYDADRKLLLAVARVNLPVTLFLDAHGRVAHLYNSTALDLAAIERLTAEHLGIRVPP